MHKLKKFLFILFFSFVLVNPFYSHGKGDIEEHPVHDMNSWQDSFDLESKKPGKYNIMITAKDLGGNTHIEGPHNIFIDPNSDLPICGITNPYPDMRVVGNLNIVGTCVDDDGVAWVDLILDEGLETEQQVRAEGKEFWSYYLDTTELEEGTHTIKVIGYDINDNPVASKPLSVAWQLDRKQPVTEVLDKEMGFLVSGSVRFDGLVSDGNGIKSLEYSVDNGKTFSEVKLSGGKNNVCSFTINIDTRKFSDGPAVLWFRAQDKAGSIGLYSFLYFIDNSKPQVDIISPAQGQVMNGKFTVAGYAKDTVGLTKLTWTFGTESGEFELIPGNPYWSVNFDTIDSKDKSRKFTIHAEDKANNSVDLVREIPLNQELDKPVTVISVPKEGQTFSESDALYVRGIATDDDKLQSVRIQLDDQEAIEQETRGVYYLDLAAAGSLSAGNHKITVSAVDVNGIVGNPVTVTIVSTGIAPEFSDEKLLLGKETLEFTNGMAIHPESGSTFSVTATSGMGLAKIRTLCEYGQDKYEENEVALKNAASYTINYPIIPDGPKGIVKFSVFATDVLERTSEYKAVYYVKNTSELRSEEPAIILDDSNIAEDGTILSDPDHPVSGYVVGLLARSAELVPKTNFAEVELIGNTFRLIPNPDAIGCSEDVQVSIKTEEGKTLKSRPIRFKFDNVFPVFTIEQDTSFEYEANTDPEAPLEFAGSVACDTGVGSLGYKILPVYANIQKGVITSATLGEAPEELTPLELAKDGSFKVSIDASEFDYGVYLVEIIAESSGGNKTATAYAIKKIPELEEDEKGKMPVAKGPFVIWLDSFDVYALAMYQGELDTEFAAFIRKDYEEGSNPVEFTVTPTETEKPTVSKFTVFREPSLSVNFENINDSMYVSGQMVILPQVAQKTDIPQFMTVAIDTGVAVNAVTYEITGDEVPGGAAIQKGSAKLIKPLPENPTRWTAEIPLSNLPVRVNKISVTVKAGGMEKTISGSIIVLREGNAENTLDDYAIYGIPGAGTVYDEIDSRYVLSKGSKYYYYVNNYGPITADLISAAPGLTIETIGKLVVLSAEKDGIYSSISIRVKDYFGDVHNSAITNFISDTTAPDLHIVTPELHDWSSNFIKLSGTAADDLGVRNVEYSLDNGENWSLINFTKGKGAALGVTFSKDIDVTNMSDGLIQIDVRATDIAGQISYAHTAVYKDVTPPEVNVVLPQEIDVVNGTNLIVFDVHDNAALSSGEYISPTVKGKNTHVELEMNPLVSQVIGTEEAPIDDAMSFVFRDEAGNSTVMEAWKFSIDNEQDLPISEIHVPGEMQVITRDFVISGVVYDDDGDSSIFYKIDDGDFKQIGPNEVYKDTDPNVEYKRNSSFSITVPLETMTDNEHTVTVYAVDINGVKGPEVTRTYRVSLEEPKGAVEKPTIDTTVRHIVTLSGTASDKNGIANIQVSLDNGNSYNDAIGTTEWHYTVDSRAIPGGTQVVFLKVTDKYGIQGLYSSLINIDNDAPTLNLEFPLDDSTTSGTLFFSGYTYDNVEVTDLFVNIRNLEKQGKEVVRKLKIDRVIGETLDIKELTDGFYNIEVTSKDKAGNVTNVSRNIHLEKNRAPATVDILYPMNGEHKQGVFTIYGQSSAEYDINSLNLYVDDLLVAETTITDCGFFKFDMGPENMAEGKHTYRVDTLLANGEKVPSKEQTITYSPIGPWITIDNFTYGDFATNRPYIRGQAGYSISEDELLLSRTKEATPEMKAAVAAKKVAKIEISFDNGKTFTQISKNEKWMYRIENQDLPEGYHFFLIRATMLNGEVAVTRTIIQIDNTPPSIRLIAPNIGGRYNQFLDVSGLSNDDVQLNDVTIALRKGDKSSYELPAFMQGMYLDFRFWGASLFSVGLGLTAFSDVVKVQLSYGEFTQQQRNAVSNVLGRDLTDGRYGGHIGSFKILATVTSIPFSYFLGHDWDWLSAAISLGADFSLFSETGSGKPQILSAIVGQLEFPKVKLQKVKFFSTFSLYTEAALWFIPTDVINTDIASMIPQIAVGLRTNIF
ncbi:MAG: hypothetical protein K5681_07050 [Treponema sp.]|nr:hypothetical protein [Treponema sp.]